MGHVARWGFQRSVILAKCRRGPTASCTVTECTCGASGKCGSAASASGKTVSVDANKARTVTVGVYAMTSGDFNGDGKSDIVAIRGDNSLHLYPGTGTGGLDSLHVTQLYGGTTWSTAREITAGDFNGDGLADLVAIWNDGSLHLYANNGSGDINPSTLLWPDNSWVGFKLLSAGDYNGDGNSDILAVHTSDGALHLYLGDGHSHLGTGTTVGALDWSTIKDIIPGDFSGDGKADLAAIWGDGTLHLYTGDGAGNFTNTGTMWNDNTWSTTKLAT